MIQDAYLKILSFTGYLIVWFFQQPTLEKALENSPTLAFVLAGVYVFMKLFDFMWKKACNSQEKAHDELVKHLKEAIETKDDVNNDLLENLEDLSDSVEEIEDKLKKLQT